MAVSTAEDYEAQAIRWGNNVDDSYTALRARLDSAVDTAPLFDTLGWVRDWEALLTEMWAAHADGRGKVQYIMAPGPSAQE